jgi:hypothetical protein
MIDLDMLEKAPLLGLERLARSLNLHLDDRDSWLREGVLVWRSVLVRRVHIGLIRDRVLNKQGKL